MTQTTITKEYKKLVAEKSQAENALRSFFVEKIQHFAKPNELPEIAKLKIERGPKNLSSRLDFYLYNK